MKTRFLPAALCAFCLAVVGCAEYPFTYIGPGPVAYDGPGSYDDFLHMHRQCQRDVASGGINASHSPYAQAAGVGAPNCASLAACMSRAGYSRSATGRFVVPPADVIPCMGG